MVIRVTDLRNGQGEYASLDDRMLVLDFQAGHPEAFVEIHRRYRGLARHVCGRYLTNGQDADEAFQETMIRVFQGLHRFNGRYALQPWIARIASNVALDAIRARDRRPQIDDGTLEERETHDPAAGPEEAVERLLERDLVISVLSDLPESHRTALVLRELEGRSHKEIGQTLGITPSQAKALIHRAKGSFRRGWLRAVTDRGGVAGIALLPLLWLIRGLEGARRVVDRVGGHAGQVAQAATPEIVSSAASSPTVAVAASSVGERVVAAGMAVLLAGGVTVGAATLAKRSDDREQARAADRVTAVAPAPPVIEEDPVAAPPETPVVDRPKKEGPDRSRGEGRNDQAEEGPLPVIPPIDDSTDDSDETEPDPGTSPDPSDGPSPEPPPPPSAPAWGFAFSVAHDSVEGCECGEPSFSGPGRVEFTPEGFRFSQVVHGGVVDASGEATWPFWLVQEAHVGPDLPAGGTFGYRFGLSSGVAGGFLYGGVASLAETIEHEDGSTTYRFEGTFDLVGIQIPPAGIPYRGFVSATMSVWADGTIYDGSFSLVEATP